MSCFNMFAHWMLAVLYFAGAGHDAIGLVYVAIFIRDAKAWTA